MYINDLSAIPALANQADTAIFALDLPDITEVPLRPFYILEPDEKDKISVEAARSLSDACTLKQATDAYIFIKQAEKLRLEAQNALLKLLEEPKPGYHFLIFTKDPSALLPTIRSRAHIYYLRQNSPLSAPVSAPEDIKQHARTLLTLSNRELPDFVESFTKKKDNLRPRTLALLAAAIEISYKSYFATSAPAYLQKLPALLACHANIKNNGHIKLHLLADLLQ